MEKLNFVIEESGSFNKNDMEEDAKVEHVK